ncbi:uncharacterized protein LY89DRAFT_662630 [Mollisia scopiformis]|uniref:Uncharacterized protein n=1 Tax=Mollisia scopiformis TaxID=149040 RepID=A0A194XU37_MOLSC|nr:uncharacterized protein LY89DRAFT_662630 [Mollisia scopiformis]KUJ23835.1 hypothetical protein LY89DRAFT_662630 [Mollisia scopiformis]
MFSILSIALCFFSLLVGLVHAQGIGPDPAPGELCAPQGQIISSFDNRYILKCTGLGRWEIVEICVSEPLIVNGPPGACVHGVDGPACSDTGGTRMISIFRAALGALLLSAFAVANPLPAPQFSTGTPCENIPIGTYMCADDNYWISICNSQDVFELVAECNGRSCAYDSQGLSTLSSRTNHIRQGWWSGSGSLSNWLGRGHKGLLIITLGLLAMDTWN